MTLLTFIVLTPLLLGGGSDALTCRYYSGLYKKPNAPSEALSSCEAHTACMRVELANDVYRCDYMNVMGKCPTFSTGKCTTHATSYKL